MHRCNPFVLILAVFVSPLFCAAQQTDLQATIFAAKDDVRAINNQQVEDARNNLLRLTDQVERWFSTGGISEAEWREYLAWEDYRKEIAAEKPNFGKINKTYQQLSSEKVGLELTQFRDLSRAIQRFSDLNSAAAIEDLPKVYSKYLDDLADDLERYEQNRSPNLEYKIGQRLDTIAGLNMSPALVSVTNSQHRRTNILADVSGTFLSAAVSRSVNRSGAVNDCILGTTIRGTSHTTGMLSTRLIPSRDRAIVEFRNVGNVSSSTRGYNSPVVIRSTGNTSYTASKRVEFTDDIFRVMPSSASARTRTRIRSVNSQNGGLFSGVISRIGENRVQQSKGQAERIAARHAETEIRSEFDKELLEEIQQLRRDYRDQFRYPLMRQGAYPDDLRFSSSSQMASLELTQAVRGQLAASTSPPPLPMGHDLVVRIDQTAISNMADTYIAGATLSETPGENPKLDVTLPEWLENRLEEFEGADTEPAESDVQEKEQRPWSITFRSTRPISVALKEGEATLTVHAASLISGKDEFKNWDIVATYWLQPENGGLALHRQGDVELFPTGFDPESGKKLPTRYVGIRANLKKVINDLTEQGDGFPKLIELPQLEPEGELESVGPLWLQQAVSKNGWLTMAWRRG